MLEYFLQRRIKNGIKRYNRSHIFKKYRDIKNILILFNIEDWFDILPIIQSLKEDHKNIKIWTIKPKETQSFKFSEHVRVLDPSTSLNWMGLFKDEILHEFGNLQYDTLIDLTSHEDPYLTYLLTQNKSEFCIGFTERPHKLYNFVLLKDEEQSLSESFVQLKTYLKDI